MLGVLFSSVFRSRREKSCSCLVILKILFAKNTSVMHSSQGTFYSRLVFYFVEIGLAMLQNGYKAYFQVALMNKSGGKFKVFLDSRR